MAQIGKILEKAAGPEAREVVVTTLDEIEQRGERRGEQRGEQRGRTQGRAQLLLELLTVRFGAVPAKVSARVHAADEATLSRWAVRVLSAPTLKDVLEEDGGEAAPARKPATRKRARSG